MISPSIRKPNEELGLHGVLRALETQYSSNEFDDLTYEERLEHLFITQVEEDRNRAMNRAGKFGGGFV